jgi:hypothetical protein
MRFVLRILLVVLVLLALATQIALAASSAMPVAPDWANFWSMTVGSGAIVLLLVDFLISVLPADYGAWVKENARIIVVILTAFCPNVTSYVLNRWPTVDPVPWTILYLGVPWLIHQILFWLQKNSVGKATPKAGV